MFEQVNSRERQLLGLDARPLPESKPYTSLCSHCGRDPNSKWFGWLPIDGQEIFACCKQRLVDIHGADPEKITEQRLGGLFGDPREMLQSVLQQL